MATFRFKLPFACAVAFAAIAATEACVGDDSTQPPDGGNDATVDGSPDTSVTDGAPLDAGPDVNPNCADASGTFTAALAFPLNGQFQGATALAGSSDFVWVGGHASAGLLSPDAGIGPSNGQNDALAFRRTSSGAVVWAVSFGGALADAFLGVTSDAAGDVYAVGNFRSTSVTFGTHVIANAGSPNPLPVVVKLSGTDGSVVWAEALPPANADSGCDHAAMRGGQLAISCVFSAPTTVPLPDGGATVLDPFGGVDGLVIALDPKTGGALWTTTMGTYGSGDAGSAAVTVDALDVTDQGAVIASGTYSGVNLQDQPSGNATFKLTRVGPTRDGWVAELSPTNGHAQWAKGFGSAINGSTVDVVRSASDGAGGVLLEGSYQGQIDLGGGPSTSSGSSDAFIASLQNKAGAPAWQKSFGGAGAELAQGISIDDCGRPIAAVRVSSALTLDSVALPAPQTSSYAEAVLKMDTSGKLLWAKGTTPPSSAFLSIQQILLNPNNGRTLVAGFFGGTVDLGGGNTATNAASGPFFIAYAP